MPTSQRPWTSPLAFFARGSAPARRRRGPRRPEAFFAQFDGGTTAAVPSSTIALGCDILEQRILLTASPAADFDFSWGTITGYHGAGGAVEIPSTIDGLPVLVIGSGAFASNGQATNPVTSVIIPSSVIIIGDYAFGDPTSRANVRIGTSVQVIGESAFSGATVLTRVVIPGSVVTIGDSAFEGATSVASVTLGSRVRTIGEGAFLGNTALTRVGIPASVRTIGDNAFGRCTSLARFDVAARNVAYRSDARGVLFNKSGTALVSYPAGRVSPTYAISSTVTSIRDHAFDYAAHLTSITIPNRVTSIGANAFAHIQGLASVTLGTGITSIPVGAFFNCRGLRSVTIPSSVTSIGDYAFYANMGLTSVTIGDHVASIGSNAFAACISLVSATISASVNSIGSSAFTGCSVLTGVTFEGNAPSVGAAAFLFVGPDAKAYRAVGLTGYGDDGAYFHGLIVATPVAPAN